MIGFQINKKIKTDLVRLQFPGLNEVCRSKWCGGKIPPCHLCENMKDTGSFKSKHLNEVHKINKKYNFNSKMAVCLIECEICGEQYPGIEKQTLGQGQKTTKKVCEQRGTSRNKP